MKIVGQIYPEQVELLKFVAAVSSIRTMTKNLTSKIQNTK